MNIGAGVNKGMFGTPYERQLRKVVSACEYGLRIFGEHGDYDSIMFWSL